MQLNDSEYIDKGPCPDCGSSDACARYTDGHTHCFACSKTRQGVDAPASQPAKRAAGLLSNVSYASLDKRQLTEETCKKFNYGITIYQGQHAQVAHYYDYDGQIVGQKIRLPNKDFRVVGDVTKAMPFGAHAFPRKGRRIVVTEGEIDAMTMSQVQGNSWPCVSIACGADKPENDFGEELPMNKIRKYIGLHRDYLLGFDEVVFMFDSDTAGTASAKVAAEVLGPTARIATLPLKDANDMLRSGRVKELIDCMWRAKKHQPDGIVELSEIVDSMSKEVKRGKDWNLPTLTKLTYGRRYGEVWVCGAGTGTGKTDFLLQEAAFVVMTHEESVGLFFLESTPTDVGLRLAGKVYGKNFHIPDDGWTTAERDAAVRTLADTNRVYLYDNFGMTEWDSITSRIRFLRNVHGVRYFVVDNLTSFLTGADDERREADRIVAESSMLAKELDVFIWLVSHLATPEGKPHEEGGQIMLRHLKGSRGIAAWAHYAIGLERNQQAEDENERVTTTIRMLKDRFTGRSTGKTFRAKYDRTTGLLREEYNPFGEQTETLSTDTGPADEAGPSDF
jgi:twinkle protein